MPADWIVPDWPAPANVRAVFTTRAGGVSEGPQATFNLGYKADDDPEAVRVNRERLRAYTGVPSAWVAQVHGPRVVDARDALAAAEAGEPLQADASITTAVGLASTVMVADCLPVLLCDAGGRAVAAAHAGWRGLCAGVIEQTVQALRARLKDEADGAEASVIAWLGPCIGPTAFEVGPEVRAAFLDAATPEERDATRAAFVARGAPQADKSLADLCALARLRLAREGVTNVSGGQWCTVGDPARFYSYRRDRVTGRMAALVWRVSLGRVRRRSGPGGCAMEGGISRRCGIASQRLGATDAANAASRNV
ncbi:peptidoglycan editing factor PgeF [Pandoraea nosoerga]|nr:peptidoglycan editing factor PgeF [Pandoraea nosoerga]MBN4665827.1 peptidoglycan editing factor PgeF [Pandoraea nosoerga]MBN4677279.1 peptidoglycan editing factor PgeF [Pandoraea nosoerga]MBN4681140.1 peptidoglycan editing factor PgeF [Pandoraea nosoerga]MBN4746367.1 peptidoglycan editing factor PgeF [Pandoraea nosoerga]